MNLFRKVHHEDGTEYSVRVDGVKSGDFDLTFDSRNAARAYKKAIKESKRQLQGHIIKRVFDEGFILTEQEIY